MLLHAGKEADNSFDESGNNQTFGSSANDLTPNAIDDDESENELVIYEGDDLNGSQLNNQSNSGLNVSLPRQSASVSKNRCDDCPFIAGTKTQLLYHKQFHRPNRHASYRCTYCSYSVSYLHLLNQHMKVHQDEQQRPLNDNESFSNHHSLEHQNDDSANEDDRDDESEIPFTFVQIGNVKRRLYQCRFCPTTSKRRTYIVVHEQLHTKNKLEDFKCSSCEFVCKDSNEFLAHLSVHKTSGPISTEQPSALTQQNIRRVAQENTNLYSSLPSVSVIDVNNIRHGNRRMFSYVCPGKFTPLSYYYYYYFLIMKFPNRLSSCFQKSW